MLALVFVFIFLSQKAFSIEDYSFKNRMQRIEKLSIVRDNQRNLSLDGAISLLSQGSCYEEGPNLSLPIGDSYWLFFGVENESDVEDICLKDSFSELPGTTRGLYILDDSGNIYPSFDFKFRLPKGERRIVALNIVPNSYSFNGVLRISPKHSYLSLPGMVNLIFSPVALFMIFLISVILGMMLIFGVPANMFYILLYLSCEIGKAFSHYFVEIGVVSHNFHVIILNLFSVVKYSMLVQLTYSLYSNKYTERLKLLLRSSQYALWGLFILLFLGETYYTILHKMSYMVSSIIVVLFTSVSFLSFYRVGRRKSLFLGMSFAVLSLLMLKKSLEMIGFGEAMPISLEFNRLVFLIPNLVLTGVVILKMVRDRKFDIAMSRNSDIAFRAIKNSYNLKDTLSKFILYSNDDMRFDSVHIFLEGDSGLNYYTSVPESSSSGASCIEDILSVLPKEKSFVCDNTKIDSNFKSKRLSNYYSSIMSLPLILETKYMGVLVFVSSKMSAFPKKALIFGKELAYKASVILNNYKQLELINLYNKRAQFEETIRMFQRDTAHDIKAPLRGIKAAISLIMKKYSEDKELMLYLEEMDMAVESAMEQVRESISMIAEIDEDFDIEYLSEELRDLKKLADMENINIVEEINIFETIRGPKKSLRNMLRSVVKNAVEALENISKSNKEIKIKYYRDSDGKLVVQVRDNGIGLAPEIKEKVISNETFSYGKREGSGHGMLIARYIAEKLGGSVDIDSIEGEYTIVTIKLDI